MSTAKTIIDPLPAGCLAVVLIAFAVYEPVKALSTLSGVGVLALVYFLRQKLQSSRSGGSSNDKKKSTDSFKWAEKGEEEVSDKNISIDTKRSSKLKNVWDVSRNSSQPSNTKQLAPKEKPFGSSYYYAHNDPNRTGGYKDGLKMEDYTMNGPRLLSKNGISVDNENSPEESADDKTPPEAPDQAKSEASTSTSVGVPKQPAAIPITKYLWDDPGDIVKGVATIYIESLPTTSRKDTYKDWKEVGGTILDVSAKIQNGGLLVQFSASLENKGNSSSPDTITSYELRIPKLFGEIKSVKTIQKEKRLLIKLTKARHNKNLEAWPHPAAKKS